MEKLIRRSLEDYLARHPEDFEKMIFLTGPRQVGKTTLLQTVAGTMAPDRTTYLNWDRPEDQIKIRDIHYTFFRELVANTSPRPIVLFDEIHKYPKWKAFLKGFYDTFRGQMVLLVTGSARLDLYRRGGDSLMGRYWLFHLHPFTLSEASGRFDIRPPETLKTTRPPPSAEISGALWRWGGFPEPFLRASDTAHRRWKRMRRERLIREDLRDLSRIQDLRHVENLMECLIRAIGSPFSLNSTRELLNVSYNAVATWMRWLESLYYCFRIPPWSHHVVRSLRKEAKCYLYDWSEVEEPGARFENFIAGHLKRAVDEWNDAGHGDFDLCYVRDQQKREVDFLIVRDKKPWMLVEAKVSEEQIPPSLSYMASRLKTPFNILVNHTAEAGRHLFVKDQGFWVAGAGSFLSLFP